MLYFTEDVEYVPAHFAGRRPVCIWPCPTHPGGAEWPPGGAKAPPFPAASRTRGAVTAT